MESLHRLGDELADLGAGTSPVRGVAVATLALAVGVTVIVLGFDRRSDQVDLQVTEAAGQESSEAAAQDTNGAAGSEAVTPDIDEEMPILPNEETEPPVQPTTTEPQSRPVQDVSLMVVNSKAPKGSAARLTSRLADQGYQTASPSNADQAVPSAVYYVEGFGPEAQDLATFLEVGPEFVIQLDEVSPPVNDRRDADILVVIAPGGPIAIP